MENVLGARRVCDLLSIFGDRQPAPTPIFHLNFLNDDEGRFKWLIEDIEEQLARSLDQGR